MPAQPTLYALLTGIDAYAYPVRPLSGCVNDILKFKKYLEAEAGKRFDVRIEVLTNEKATKANVVKQFEQHLGKAGAGDVALFYYSGHGAQEKADPVLWRFEPDGKLEGLVCYDSIPGSGSSYNLLTDKELRFLIYKVVHGSRQKPKTDIPHLVTIFDCCHSGTNTRNIYIGKESRAAVERRFKPMPPREGEARMGSILPVRKWEQFIFAKEVNKQDIQTKPLDEVMPDARYIQLAACQSDESAYESGGAGVFSRNLIDVLQRSEGAVTYLDLRSRLRCFIKNQFQQSPQIFGGGGPEHASDLYQGFLLQATESKPLFGNVVYNPKIGWIMDLGAIHGVAAQADGIRVVEVGNPKQLFKASIKSISASETVLTFDPATEGLLSRDKALYRGYIDGYRSAPIRVFVQDIDKEEGAVRALKDALAQAGDNLSLAEKEREADYTVHLMVGRYSITRSGDPFRPVVFPQKGYTPAALNQTLLDLRHISQWEYVRNLHNEGANRLPLDAVTVAFYRVLPDGRPESIALTADEVRTVFEAGQFDGRAFGGNIRIEIRNRSSFPIYVSMLYLSSTFEVYGGLLAGKVLKIEPAGSAWVFDGGNVGLLYEPAVELFNHPESLSYFKLIASCQEFSVDALEQDALADPALLAFRSRSSSKGITRPAVNADADAWMTRLFVLRMPNPRYEKVTLTDRRAWEKTDAGPWVKKIYK